MLNARVILYHSKIRSPIRYSSKSSVQRAIKKVEEVRIPVPWGHIAGKWWGDTSKQPIIGLHGWEDNAGSFDKLAPLLDAPSFLAIDFPGHGLSSHLPPGVAYSALDNVMALRRVVKHHNWSTASFVGHSYGSSCVFLYAAVFPKDVRAYVAIECARSVFSTYDDIDFEQMHRISDGFPTLEEKLKTRQPPSYTYNKILDLFYSGNRESPTKESCKVLLKRGILPSEKPNTFYFSRDPRFTFRPLTPFSAENILKCAQRINCHHLSLRSLQGFLVGGQEKEVYMKSLHLIKKSGFHFEHHDIEGSHHVHLNDPERVAPLINSFLSSVVH